MTRQLHFLRGNVFGLASVVLLLTITHAQQQESVYPTHPTRMTAAAQWKARNQHGYGRASPTSTSSVAAAPILPTATSSPVCDYKDLLSGLHDRVSVLATLDEYLRNRLSSIEAKMVQFETNNLARLDSVALQQKDFLQRLDSMEHIERLTRRDVAEMKGDCDEVKKGDKDVLSRQSRQVNALPDMFLNETKLESLALLLTSTRSAIRDLDLRFESEIKKVRSQILRRFNNLERQRNQVPNFYTPVSTEQTLVKSCAQDETPANGLLRLQLTVHSDPFYVMCEEEIFGGGWTVIQNRFNGKVNFHRDWFEYKAGFGNLAGEFWIGLEKLHALTKSAVHELIILLQDFDNEQRYARYNAFAIGSEQEFYTLNVLGAYEGDAGDSLTYHAGHKFSTYDSDNDGCPDCNCAQARQAGWWYNWCDMSNLNGVYFKQNFNNTPLYQGMYWQNFRGAKYSLKAVRMMIRPVVAGQDSSQR